MKRLSVEVRVTLADAFYSIAVFAGALSPWLLCAAVAAAFLP